MAFSLRTFRFYDKDSRAGNTQGGGNRAGQFPDHIAPPVKCNVTTCKVWSSGYIALVVRNQRSGKNVQK